MNEVFFYVKITTTYAILMSLPLIIHMQILVEFFSLPSEPTPRYLKVKPKLRIVKDVNVRFAPYISPMLVIFSLFFCDPKTTRNKAASL